LGADQSHACSQGSLGIHTFREGKKIVLIN
jgi:hypothetical protein